MDQIIQRLQKHAKKITTFSVWLGSLALSSIIYANPVLQNIEHGDISVQQTSTTTTINQTTQNGIVNWQSFNIQANEHTHFEQPENAWTLNKISGSQGVSEIYGKLTATSNIILVNPAGIFFGPRSFINVGGLIATTAGISKSDFLSGNFRFNQIAAEAGSITNQGRIVAMQNGLIALVANGVSNSGHIEANLGNVVIGSANTFTMTFDGADYLAFQIDKGAAKGITNTGTISANGGRVEISAKAAQDVLSQVVNLDGVIEANSVGMSGGTLRFMSDAERGYLIMKAKARAKANDLNQKGGSVTITGRYIVLADGAVIDVSGPAGGGDVRIGGDYQGQGDLSHAMEVTMMPTAAIYADATHFGNGGKVILWSDDYTKASGIISARGGPEGGNGGLVETSSKNILDVGNMLVNASAPNGKTGLWLLDPTYSVIDAAAASSIVSSLASANVTNTSASSITVSSGITWTSANTLSLIAATDIIINAAISGINGRLELTAQNASQSITTGTSGTISVSEFALLAGQWYQNTASLPAFSATNSFEIATSGVQFLRVADGNGSTTPYSIKDVYGLQGIGSNSTLLASDFQLSNDIDASGTSTWNSGAGFVPIGNGTTNYTGDLNGQKYEISNLHISRSTENTAFIGVLGISGTVSNLGLAYADITSTYNGHGISGTFTGLNKGSLTNVWSREFTYSTSLTYQVGGLAGRNEGPIVDSWATGSMTARQWAGGLVGSSHGDITRSWSNVDITASGSYIGGISGDLNSVRTIKDSYALGNVSGSSSIGGLVGYLNGTITRSYSTGLISGGSNTGGLIGYNNSGTVNDSFWDTETSGRSLGFGGGSGTFDALGGCMSTPPCTNGGTVDLSLWATYTNMGWSSAGGVEGSIHINANTGTTAPNNTWFIFNGDTRPILMSELFPTLTTTNPIRNAHQLQLMGALTGQAYTLGNDVDASWTNTTANDVWGSSGFKPVTISSGSINGNGYAINDLYINRTTESGLLSGLNSGTIQNLVLRNPSITTTTNVGGITPVTSGTTTIENVFIDGGQIKGSGFTGGIIGYKTGSSGTLTIQNSGNSANVEGNARVGGIIGDTYYGNVIIENTYNSGTITGNGDMVGGLAGSLWPDGGTVSVTDSYSTGQVINNSTDITDDTGGLIGRIYSGSAVTIDNAYSTGKVTINGTLAGGGLIGEILSSNATISNSFWDAVTSGITKGYDVNSGSTITNLYAGCFAGSGTCAAANITNATDTGATVTPKNLSQATTFTNEGWNLSTTWGIIENQSYPYLKAFYTSTPRALSGTVSGDTGGTQVSITSNSDQPFDAVTTSPNGFFYILAGNNTISGVDTSLSDGANALLYLDTNGGTVGNTMIVAPTSTGSLSELVISPNEVRYKANSSGSVSNSNFFTARGTNTDTDIIFTGSTDLSLNNTTYSLAFDVDDGATLTYADNMSSTNDLIKYGDGTLYLSNANMVLGNTAINAGLLRLNVASGTLTYGNIISGNGALEKIGNGTLALTGTSSTYSGGTTISAGTLTIADDRSLGAVPGAVDADNITINGATLRGNDAFVELNANRGITISGNNVNITSLGSSTSNEFIVNGDITGTVNNFYASTYLSTLTLNGNNDFITNNRIILGSGTILSINSDSSLGANTNDVVFGSGGGGTLVTTADMTLHANRTLSPGPPYSMTIRPDADTVLTIDSKIEYTGGSTGNIVFDGQGTTILSAIPTNDYNGNTYITNGKVIIQTPSAFSDTTDKNIFVQNGGELEFAFNNAALANTSLIDMSGSTSRLTFSGTNITINNNIDLATTTMGGAGSATIIGDISGSNLTKDGSGSLTLTGTNGYTGITNINDGRLIVNSDARLGNTATDISFDGGILQTTGFTLNDTRDITMQSGGGTIDVTSGTLTYSGAIDGSGSFTKTGAGSMILSGGGTLSGAVNLNEGNLTLQHANALGNANSSQITIASGTQLAVDFDGTFGNTGQINFGGTLRNTNGAGDPTLTNNILLTNNSTDINAWDVLTLSGVIDDGGNDYNLTKTAGYGQLRLTNPNNTYGGKSYFSGGAAVIIANDGSLGDTPSTLITDAITLGANENLFTLNTSTDVNLHANRGITLLGGGANTININNSSTLTINGPITGSSNYLTFSGGSNSFIDLINPNNDFTAPIRLAGNTHLRIAEDAVLGNTSNHISFSNIATLQTTTSFELNSNRELLRTSPYSIYLAPDSGTELTYNGNITNEFTFPTTGFGTGLTINGNGTTILGGTSDLDGNVLIQNGTVKINSPTALSNYNPNNDNNIYVSNGANLQFTFNNNTLVSELPITLSHSGTKLTFNGSGVVLNNPISVAGHTFDGTGTATLNGIISGSDLTKDGTGAIAFNGVNTYVRTFLNDGIYQIATDRALGADPGGSYDADRVTFDGGTLQNTADVTIATNRGFTFNGGNGTFINDANTTLTHDGIFTGAGGFTKTSLGTLSLGGNNSYDGTTNINQGRLQARHALALGSVTNGTTVASGATLELQNVIIANENLTSIAGTGNTGLGALITSGTAGLNGNITLSGNTLFSGGDTMELFGNIDESGGAQRLTYNYNGTVTINGNNSYSGGTIIDEGRLITNHNNAFGTNHITAHQGATIQMNDGIAHANNMLLNGTGYAAEGVLVANGNSTSNGIITLGSDSTFGTLATGQKLILNGTTDGTYNLRLVGDGTIRFAGNVGSNAALATLLADTKTEHAANITTYGNQTYNNVMTNTGNYTLKLLDEADIALHDILNPTDGIFTLLGVLTDSRILMHSANNNIVVTSGHTGTINNTVVYSGFRNLVSRGGQIKVDFTVPTIIFRHSGRAIVNDFEMFFSNIDQNAYQKANLVDLSLPSGVQTQTPFGVQGAILSIILNRSPGSIPDIDVGDYFIFVGDQLEIVETPPTFRISLQQ